MEFLRICFGNYIFGKKYRMYWVYGYKTNKVMGIQYVFHVDIVVVYNQQGDSCLCPKYGEISDCISDCVSAIWNWSNKNVD